MCIEKSMDTSMCIEKSMDTKYVHREVHGH